VPALVVRVPLEGAVRVRLLAGSAEDECALARHLRRRDLGLELALAIDELLVWLAENGAGEEDAA
jgi:hypothetical protein